MSYNLAVASFGARRTTRVTHLFKSFIKMAVKLSCFYLFCFFLSIGLTVADEAESASSVPAAAPSAGAGADRLCSVSVPQALLEANRDSWPYGTPGDDAENKYQYDTNTWSYGGTPATDDVDRYMLNHTGCTYGAGTWSLEQPLGAEAYDGARFERRLALRARGGVVLRLALGHEVTYYFSIGSGGNNLTEISHHGPGGYSYWNRHTPRVLSADRYVPFYVRIHAGTLSLGAACGGGEPLFSRALPAPPAPGASLATQLEFDDMYGAKFLYDCPTHTQTVTTSSG